MKLTSLTRWIALLAVTAIGNAGSTALAASITFTNAADNDITNGANWSGGGVAPAFGGNVNDRLNFHGTTTYSAAQGTTVVNAAGTEGRSLSIDNGGVLTVTGGTLDVSTTPGSGSSFIANGSNDSGTLIVDGGNVDFGGQDIITVFNGSNSTATIQVDSGSITVDQFKGNSGDAGSVFNLDLNGGVTSLRRLTTEGSHTVDINFNGGTLRQASGTDVSASQPTIPAGDVTATIQAGGLIVDTNGFDSFVNPILNDGGGNGGVTKLGAGTLRLSSFGGASTYTGATSVQAGTLRLVTEDFTGGSATTVEAGASLVGTATTNFDVSLNGGTIGGNNDGSIGTLTIASLSATASGGLMDVEFDSDANSIDVIAVTGVLDLTDLDVSFEDLGASSLVDAAYVFASYGSLVGSAFASELAVPAGYEIDYAFGGNSIALVTTVPEPTTVWLLGATTLAAVRLRHRNRVA